MAEDQWDWDEIRTRNMARCLIGNRERRFLKILFKAARTFREIALYGSIRFAGLHVR